MFTRLTSNESRSRRSRRCNSSSGELTISTFSWFISPFPLNTSYVHYLINLMRSRFLNSICRIRRIATLRNGLGMMGKSIFVEWKNLYPEIDELTCLQRTPLCKKPGKQWKNSSTPGKPRTSGSGTCNDDARKQRHPDDVSSSNCAGALLIDILRYARIEPQVLQIELHPYLTQEPIVDLAKTLGIAITGYSSFGPQGNSKTCCVI